MHPLPSHLAYGLCQARTAELARGRRHRPARSAGRARPPQVVTRSVRQSTGWFLVELGLRLAAPRSRLGAVR